MRTKVEFTYEGLKRARSHVTSQLKMLSDADLESIQLACEGRFRTRNASMLINLSGCGVSDVLQLWEHDGGRRVLISSIKEILTERNRTPVDIELWRNVGKLA